MSHGSLLGRLVPRAHWSWVSDDHRDRLPPDLDATVFDLESDDRLHAKQGRSTCRVRFDTPSGPLSVYLKRHDRLSWWARLAAWLDPDGRHSPGAAEWSHLRRARALGIPVPEAVAAGERVGPWGTLRSYLLVAELVGCLPLHEAIPALAGSLDPPAFAAFKRGLIAELARCVATLHEAHAFHKDLYLCHFFLDMGRIDRSEGRLHLIDLHRMGFHRWTAWRWRCKDLAQLLFSTIGVEGIDDRDGLRFWMRYRKATRPTAPRWQARVVRAKAAHYLAHNR